MKYLYLLFMLISSQAFALEAINCTNSLKPDQTYRFQELRSGDYQLTVKNLTQDSASCRSRWGCDTNEVLVYEDTLKATDYQGSMYFESKKTHVNMEYMDEVSYDYTVRTNGSYVTMSETLYCEIE